MTWLRVDDGMLDHRKWAALEDDPRTWSECVAVWLALATYCARTLSDGHVPESRVARLTPLGARARQRCDDLVGVGLLERVPDGYVLHDWHQYQASRSQVEAKRDAKTRRQQRWRDARVDASTSAPVDASTSRLRDAPRDAPVEPAPSHPIPSHPPSGGGRARAHVADPVPAEAVPLPEADPVESALRRGYAERYQRGARDAWMSCARDDAHIRRAAVWCRAQAAPLEAAARFLDGAFGHESWRAKRWPWKWLAEDPGLTASRSTMPVGSMGEHASIDAARAAAMAAIPTMDVTPMEGETW